MLTLVVTMLVIALSSTQQQDLPGAFLFMVPT